MSDKLNVEKVLDESKNLNRDFLEFQACGEDTLKNFTKTMETKYSYLYDNFKSIFNISMSTKYDFQRLTYMVNMAGMVKENKITEKEASVQVGQILVDEIVKPQLDKNKSS